MGDRRSRSGNRILLEQSGDHRRVEVGTNSHDQFLSEINYPAVAIVEAHAVRRRRQRMKFDYRLVVLYDQILHMELRAVWENLAQLGEGALPESLLATVVTGERVGAHHCPVDVVSYPFEECSAVAVLKSLKNFANTVGCNCHLNLSLY